MEKEKEEIFDERDVHQEEELFEDEKAALKEAFFAFAKAAGKKPEEISGILRKGMEFDGMNEKYGKAKGDSEIFEKLAEIRGISAEEMKNEILWALEKAQTEKAIREIMAENPGMNRKTAKELADLRRKAEKPLAQKPENTAKERLSELDKFIAKHSGEKIETLAESVIAEWENGIPLETAFEKYMAVLKNTELSSEIEKLKNEQRAEAMKKYAREHTTGSANSAAGASPADEFIEELFKEY